MRAKADDNPRPPYEGGDGHAHLGNWRVRVVPATISADATS